MTKLNAYTIRRLKQNTYSPTQNTQAIYLILDNVLDTYNIGGLFRLSEASGVKRLFITGKEALTPPSARIHKSSIGTHRLIPWDYCIDASTAIKRLQAEVPNIQFVALEQTPTSINILQATFSAPLALIVGNETHGASQETLSLCHQHVEIPMLGQNISMNVIVSTGIALYEINRQLGNF